MNQPDAAPQWTEAIIRRLLLEPHTLLQAAPWRDWILALGGFQALHAHLRALPLAAPERQLLEALLADPGAHAATIAHALGLSESTYYRRLKRLAAQLADQPMPQPGAATAPDQPAPAAWGAALPPAPARLFGRAAALDALDALLDQQPLLTLAGPGGIGKTSLALALAQRRQAQGQPVAVLSLAALSDPALVLPTILAALGAADLPALARSVSAAARPGRPPLLVLDNLEQLLAARADLQRLRDAAPQLRLLLTSRIPLGLPGETVAPLAPLAVPADADDPAAADSPAVRLFVARARQVDPAFALDADNRATIAAICQRLDGLPLAIELAAARGFGQAPALLLAHMDRRLALLTDGPADLPARQQTLRATLDWSCALLSPAAQTLLAALGAFAGSWSHEAACAIAPDRERAEDALAELAAHALISPAQPAPGAAETAAWQMLETIREYAAELLAASPERHAILRGFIGYYRALTEQIATALHQAIAMGAMDRLQWELPNLRRVLETSLGEPAWREHGAWTAIALWRFWYMSGRISEGLAFLRRFLDGPALEPLTRARCLEAFGLLSHLNYERAAADVAYEECMALYQHLEEPAGMMRLHNLIAHQQPTLPARRAHYEQSLALAREINDLQGQANALFNLALTFQHKDDNQRAIAMYAETLPMFEELGDLDGIALTHSNLGAMHVDNGNFETGLEYHQKSLALRRRLADHHGVTTLIAMIGRTCRQAGRLDQARRYFVETMEHQLTRDFDLHWVSLVFIQVATLLSILGWPERAARLLGAANRLDDDAVGRHFPKDDPEYALAQRLTREALPRHRWTIEYAYGYAQPTRALMHEAIGWLRDELVVPPASPTIAPEGAAR